MLAAPPRTYPSTHAPGTKTRSWRWWWSAQWLDLQQERAVLQMTRRNWATSHCHYYRLQASEQNFPSYYISWHVLRVSVLPAAVCSLKDWPENGHGPERAVRYEWWERGVVEERVEPMRRVLGRLCSQCSVSTNEHWRPTAPAHWLERAGQGWSHVRIFLSLFDCSR